MKKPKKVSLDKAIKLRSLNFEIIGLIVILVFALFLRVYSLGNAPLWIDEASSANAARMIVETGKPVMDSGLNYGYRVFHYLMSFFLLFGISDFNVRLVSVVFGLLTIVLGYFIGKEYSKESGLLTALFLAVFYLEVFYSRQARMYQMFQFMFFLSLYLLYKSGRSKKYENLLLVLSIICFFITLDTHLAGLILAPFFIIHIVFINKPKYLAVFPLYVLVRRFIGVKGLTSESSVSTINYASRYFEFTTNMRYLLLLFIPGIVWAFFKKRVLTSLIIVPCVVFLIGIFSLKTFAFRYSYFFAFPLVLYSSVLMGLLYEKYGKIILIAIIGLLLIPSNLVFPYTGVNIIKPISYNYFDYSAPETNYKQVPLDVKEKLINPENTLVSIYSSDVYWYLKKPDYVIPFSMTGVREDEVSVNKTVNGVKTDVRVDMYSGALILQEDQIATIKRPYYITADSFSANKLNEKQASIFNKTKENCNVIYSANDLRIFECL